MIVISLDEGGRFELIRKQQCMLIGGTVFQCETEEDIKKEKQSLERFFRTVCSEQECSYPADLHYNRSGGKVINAETAEKVKKALAEEMPDYLCKRGRWAQGRPAGSTYYAFCMVGDQNGLDDNSAGNLRDDVATVRYDHMIYRTIENIIFYNPRFQDEKNIVLHLPTRVIQTTDPFLTDELKQLGYSRHKNNQGVHEQNVFDVTDPASFRTCLESALLSSDRNDLIFDLSVQSINYETPQFHQMFLYLADTMCSVYQDAISGLTTNAQALPALDKYCSQLVNSSKALLWAYHPADRQWRKIWKRYSNGNWFDALINAGELRFSNQAVKQIYSKIWVRPFEEDLAVKNDFSALSEAVFRLDQYMLNKSNRNQNIGMYIMNLLKENYRQITDEKERGVLEYRLSKIMMGLYNHCGEFTKAQEEYNKCVNAARYVPIEEYLGLQLPYSVSLCDARRFEEAEKVASALVSHHELLNAIKEDVYPGDKTIYDSYARALSQDGQCLAFLEKYDEGLERFNQALDIFESGTQDWLVTSSYRLHLLIEKGDRDTYTELARAYFGAGSPKKQFAAILNRKCGSVPFALYLFLKGLWVFQPETDPQTIREFTDKVSELQRISGSFHPWEQIMKYCAFLQCRCFEADGCHTESAALMETERAILQGTDGILQVIAEENEKQYALVLQGKDFTTGSKLNFTYR